MQRASFSSRTVIVETLLERRSRLFSLTVMFGFLSLGALLIFVSAILRQLGAGEAARALLAVSVLGVVASVVLLYLL